MGKSVSSVVGGKAPRHLQSSISTELLYSNSFKAVEIKKVNGKKVAYISGELMNSEVNDNNWGIDPSDCKFIIEGYNGSPVKLNHGGILDVIGTGESAIDNGDGTITYSISVNNPDIIAKFETGELNERNCGVSPHLGYEDIKCSICGYTLTSALEDGREIERDNTNFISNLGCGHKIGSMYDDKKAAIMPVRPYIKETTVTEEPAYKRVGSGTITNIAVMTASLNKLCSSYKLHETKEKDKMEAETMAETLEKEKVDQLLAEKDAEICTLKAELKDRSDADLETLKAEVSKFKKEKDTFLAEKKTLTEEMDTLKASIEEKDTFISEVIKKQRELELQAIVDDKELVAEILSKTMTEDEFVAEVKKLKKVIELTAKISMTGGSSPTENLNKSDTFEAMLGCSKTDFIAKMGIKKE